MSNYWECCRNAYEEVKKWPLWKQKACGITIMTKCNKCTDIVRCDYHEVRWLRVEMEQLKMEIGRLKSKVGRVEVESLREEVKNLKALRDGAIHDWRNACEIMNKAEAKIKMLHDQLAQEERDRDEARADNERVRAMLRGAVDAIEVLLTSHDSHPVTLQRVAKAEAAVRAAKKVLGE